VLQERSAAISAASPVNEEVVELDDDARAAHPHDRRQDAGATPWSKRREHAPATPLGGPIPLEELHNIAEESSMTERRADEAERELMEWKKVKFMQDRVGEDFDALIISVTKYGLFVELNELFIEGLVPINSLTDDRYTYRENTRQIIGEHSRKTYSLGDRVRVILDRIDRAQRKLQFALLEETPVRKGKAGRNLARQKKNQKKRN